MQLSPYSSQPSRRAAGSALILVLMILALVSFIAVSVLFATQLDYRASKSYIDQSAALSYADGGVHEALYRLNLKVGNTAPPSGSTINVNNLASYNARLQPDEFGLLTNKLDDDLDGLVDEVDELQLVRDWSVRILLTPSAIAATTAGIVVDTNPTAGPPWGSRLLVPTIQPQTSWQTYSDPNALSSDLLEVRFFKESDTPLGDSEGDGDEIVFYNSRLPINGVDDLNSVTRLGSGTRADEIPANITWKATPAGSRPIAATGTPLLRVQVTGREGRGRRRVTAVIIAASTQIVTGMGLCGCKKVDVKGASGRFDSYSAGVGPYGGANIGNEANIGSNGDITIREARVVSGSTFAWDDIVLEGNAVLDGNTTLGGRLDIKQSARLTGTASTVSPGPKPCDCADVKALVATAKASNQNHTLPSPLATASNLNTSVILNGGTYYFEEIDLALGARIQVGVDNNNDGIVDGPATTPVVIYVQKKVRIFDDAEVNTRFGRPADLEIVALGNVDIEDAAKFRGRIRAPESKLEVKGTAEIFGSVIAEDVKYDSIGGFHVDSSLFGDAVGPSEYTLLAWHSVD